MTTLKPLYALLRQEYAASRHIVWQDESGATVNDVTYTLRLVVTTARELRGGNQTSWQKLVRYALSRSMSQPALSAIDTYLRPCGQFPPLCFTPLDEAPTSVREVALPIHISGHTDLPEPDRLITSKPARAWTPYPWRLAPHMEVKRRQFTHCTHWLA